jgi:hypothetical protein
MFIIPLLCLPFLLLGGVGFFIAYFFGFGVYAIVCIIEAIIFWTMDDYSFNQKYINGIHLQNQYPNQQAYYPRQNYQQNYYQNYQQPYYQQPVQAPQPQPQYHAQPQYRQQPQQIGKPPIKYP